MTQKVDFFFLLCILHYGHSGISSHTHRHPVLLPDKVVGSFCVCVGGGRGGILVTYAQKHNKMRPLFSIHLSPYLSTIPCHWNYFSIQMKSSLQWSGCVAVLGYALRCQYTISAKNPAQHPSRKSDLLWDETTSNAATTRWSFWKVCGWWPCLILQKWNHLQSALVVRRPVDGITRAIA